MQTRLLESMDLKVGTTPDESKILIGLEDLESSIQHRPLLLRPLPPSTRSTRIRLVWHPHAHSVNRLYKLLVNGGGQITGRPFCFILLT